MQLFNIVCIVYKGYERQYFICGAEQTYILSYNIELERYHKECFVEMNQQSKYKDSMFTVEVMVTMHSYNYLIVVLSHPN